MDVVLKTLLYSYPSFASVKEGLFRLIEHKAVVSFHNCSKTLEQMNNIIKLNNQIAKVSELEKIVQDLLSDLNTKERMLIEYKFFKRQPPIGFDYSSRTYFRAQEKVFKHLLIQMKINKYDHVWFLTNYSDLYFLISKYNSLKKRKALGSVSNSVVDAES